MSDLCSLVFILQPQHPFAFHAPYLGRMAHKLFLYLLDYAGQAELATSLHDHGAHHFTVSDLFPHGDQQMWLRVTGLNAKLCAVLHALREQVIGVPLALPPRAGSDEAAWQFRVVSALMTHHEWAGETSYEGLVSASWRKPRGGRLRLEFVTPTAIKSVGVYQGFPTSGLVFRLLYERWLRLTQTSLPWTASVEAVEAFATYHMEVSGYRLMYVETEAKVGVGLPSFRGWVSYRLLNRNKDYEHRVKTRRERRGEEGGMGFDESLSVEGGMRLMNLLSDFVFYSGVGSSTSQGMGMVRRVM